MMMLSLEKEFFEQEKWIKFKEPLLDFSPGQSKKINSPIMGIQQEGPFDFNIGQRRFKNIEFIILVPEASNYYSKIKKMLNVMEKTSNYFNGFTREFHLEKVSYPDEKDYIPYQINDRDSIEDSADRIAKEYRSYSQTSETVPLVLIAGPDYRILRNTPNYDTTKKEILRSGFPNQYLSDYTSQDHKIKALLASTSDRNFIYSLWNTMISIYAKAGGIPWTLKNKLNDSCGEIDLVTGFRFARNQIKSSQEFVVGIASVFGCNGRWRGFSSSEFDEFNEFKTTGLVIPQEQMESFVNDIVRDYRRWELSRKPKTVVLHKIGSYHTDEIKAASNVFDSYEIESYSLIEIKKPDSFRLFDIEEDSKCIPRGLTRSISKKAALLCTTGVKTYNWYNRQKSEEFTLGSPKPIIVTVRSQKNGFNSPIDAAKHVFALTALHWQYVIRGQTSLPVTLEYAQDIAKKYARGIRPHDNLLKTPWFL